MAGVPCVYLISNPEMEKGSRGVSRTFALEDLEVRGGG